LVTFLWISKEKPLAHEGRKTQLKNEQTIKKENDSAVRKHKKEKPTYYQPKPSAQRTARAHAKPR